MKKSYSKSKGITLVALIVTVIILIILAGISIASLTGNGLFEKAKLAKEKQENSGQKEEIIMNNMINIMNEYSISSSTREDLADLTQGTATEEDILKGKTAWVNGKMLTGTNNNNIKAYVLGSISTYSTDSSQYAAFGYYSNNDYFTCTGNVAVNYLTIDVLKDMDITIVLQESGRGTTINKKIEISNTTVITDPIPLEGNYVYETNVLTGDTIKITANRLSGAVRGTAILILGK